MTPHAAYIDLVLNLSLLVALTVVSGFVDKRWARTTREGLLVQGLLFGTAAMLGMLRPFTLQPGLFYDGRSVLISLGSLFFGPWVAVISGAMAIVCRISMGGTGAVVGTTVIAASALIGLAARRWMDPAVKTPTVRQLFLLGIVVHVAMVLLMLLRPDGLLLVGQIGPPVMLLYPLATILAGKILSDQVNAERALQALRESRERYELIFQSGNDGVFVHPVLDDGTLGCFTEVNEVACERLGYSREELLRMSHLDIDAGEMGPPAAKVVEDLLRRGHAIFETIHVTKSGDKIPVEVSSRVFDSKGKDHVLSTVRDITDRKQAAEALRDSEERFRSVVENAPDAIFVQTDFRFAFVNRACLELLGAATADDLIGREVQSITHPEFREAIAERMRLLNEERAPVARIQYRVVRLDGTAVPVEVGAVPFTFGGENGALVFMHDITLRREAEARMTQQLEELRRWHEATVGREMRVFELKREVNRAMALAGQPPPYPSAEDGG